MHALKLIGALLLSGFFGLLVVASRAPGGAPPPDTLIVGLSAEPRSLDPHTTTASSDFRVLVNVYEGLARFATGTLTPEPALATHWEISKDGRQYTFFLKAGVKFHDGSAFDAEAVKFNFDRMLNQAHPYHHTGPFPLAFFFESVERVRVMAPLVVRLELSEPFAPLLANLSYPTGLFVSPAAVRRAGKALGRHPVGTGAFRFVSWQAGRSVLLQRNHDYHSRPPQLAKLVFRPVSDPMTRVAELRAKRIDLAVELSPDNVHWFRQASDFSVSERAGPHLWFLILNLKTPPFNDKRVRQAVNLAVNKQALVAEVLQHTASVAAGPIPQAFGPYAGETAPYPYDPERARRLLRQAGVVPGQRLVLAAPQSGSGMLAPVAMATAIQADLKLVGFDVQIESYEWNSYLAKVNAGLDELHMAEMAWMTNDPDTLPFLALRSEAQPPAGFNSGWYHNAEVDALLERGRRETSPTKRQEYYARVQQLVHEDAPWLFVASWKQNVVAQRSVQDIQLEPSFLLHLNRITKR